MLLRPIFPRIAPLEFSFHCPLSVKSDLAASPMIVHENRKCEADETAVTKVVKLLQAADNDWNFEQLRRILYNDYPFSAHSILQVIRSLGSYFKAIRLFEWVESDYLSQGNSSLRSAAFQGIVELASKEADWKNRFPEILAKLKSNNVPISIKTATLLIKGFSRAGMASESLDLYSLLQSSLKITNVRNLFIQSLLNTGHATDALCVLNEMFVPNEKVPPNSTTSDIYFRALLKLEGTQRGFPEKRVIEFVLKFSERGLFPNPTYLTQLIRILCRNGKIGVAWDILHVVMKFHGPLEINCCNALLSALRICGDINRINVLLAEMKQTHIQPNISTFGILISHLCKIGKVDEAIEVFDKMSAVEDSYGVSILRTVITYNTIIEGLCKVGRPRGAHALFRRMKSDHGCSPNIFTFGCLIAGFCREGNLDMSIHLFGKMKEMGVSPDVILYNTLIHGLCKVGRQEEALALMQSMESDHRCNSPDVFTFNILIDGFCKAGDMDTSNDLFDKMKEMRILPNEVTLSTMVDGMCQHGRVDSAMELFTEMKRKGLGCDDFTYNILIKAFCLAKNTETAKKLFNEMIDNNVRPTLCTYRALIKGYFLNGMKDEAMEIFRGMSCRTSKVRVQPNTVIYNIVITGLCRNNDLETAMSLLDEMKRDSVKLDSFTCTSIFWNLREMNRLKEAFELMDRMKEEGCVPNFLTLDILTKWLSAVGETEKWKNFVAFYKAIA